MTSAIIVDIRNAVMSVIARVDDSCALYSTRPSWSSTRRISIGVGTRPWLANAAYAAVIDCSVTSPEPSASDGTLGTSPTPIVFAYCTVRGMPTCWSSRTAARLLDVRRPVRRLIDVADECSSSGVHAPCSGLDRIVEVIDDRRRREARFERGGVDERLERGARLPMRLNGAVEVAGVEVAAADHRADVAGGGIERDQRRLQHASPGSRRRAGFRVLLPRRRAARLPGGAPCLDRLDLLGDAASAATCIGMSMVVKTRSPP